MGDQNRDMYQWDGSDVSQPGGQERNPNRDMYQWDGSDVRQPADTGVPGGRFRQEAYDPRGSQPRHYELPRGGGGDNINLVVYGDVYINQGGSWGRPDGRREYYGRQYSYEPYVDPRYRQPVPYEEFAYRRQQRRHSSSYSRSGNYDDGGYGNEYRYRNPSGYEDYRDQQYSGGYGQRGYYPPNYYEGGNYGGSGFGRGGCYPSDFDRGAQVFDFIVRGMHAYADIRRSTRGHHHGRHDQSYDYGNQYGVRQRGNYQHGWQRRRGY